MVEPSALSTALIGKLPCPFETRPENCLGVTIVPSSLRVESKMGAPKCTLPLTVLWDREMAMVNAPVPKGVVMVPLQLPEKVGV